MKDSTTYKTSDNTPLKQDSLRQLLWWHMDIVKTIWKKRPYMKALNDRIRPYRYYELHGGYGVDENGNPGSPLIFHNVAREHDIPYKAIIYERDLNAFNSLRKQTESFKDYYLYNEDHTKLLEIYSDPKFQSIDKYRKYHFGVIYSDPSNADPSTDVLRKVTNAYPKLDIILNLAAASYKRTSHLDDYTNLKDELFSVKKIWILRKPIGNHQWTMLLGSNWLDFPEWEQKGFVRFDSDVGREWFDKVAYTKQERHAKYNPPLL